jgi:putative ABC transport system ATP-binding protein/lipoprotein-releasing system ATP-binding protein
MTIESKDLVKSFGSPATEVLRRLSFEIQSGEFVAITGRSGSGKSTLLYILSTLDSPSAGDLLIDGSSIRAMNQTTLHRFRNQNMGFIFQFHYLLPELTALENVLMPAMKTGAHKKRRAFAESLLEQMDLGTKLHRLPSQLSGGEQQRVAIARALVMEPKYLFADEPTGNLDSTNGDKVMQILRDINNRLNTTVIMVTHDPDYAAMAGRRIHLVDGRIMA